MKVTCPKCQFENQADSSRVVCARCATIIEVRMDQGFDSNGKRQTARLPFTSGGLGAPSLGSQRFNQSDVYATRIGDDFDDVLDVPIQPQPSYQTVDDTPPAPIFEDVFTTGQNQDPPSPYDFAYDKPSAPLSAPLDAFATPVARQREPQDYIEPVEQEYVGWPVLPETQDEEEEETKSGRGGLFLRLGLIFGLLGVLSFWGYYFLGDWFAKRKSSRAQTTEMTSSVGDSESAINQPPDTQGAPDLDDVKPSTDADQPPLDSFIPENSNKAKGVVTVPPEPKGETPIREPETPAPAKIPVSRGVEFSSRGGLTVQVGSFKDQAEADARAASLNAATGGAFHVVQANIPGKGTWYRVQQVNGFATREAALKYGNGLRTQNLISDFIVTTR